MANHSLKADPAPNRPQFYYVIICNLYIVQACPSICAGFSALPRALTRQGPITFPGDVVFARFAGENIKPPDANHGAGRFALGLFFWGMEVPSGKRLHNYGKIHHFLWDNPLFLWPFSIAMLVYQRVNVPAPWLACGLQSTSQANVVTKLSRSIRSACDSSLTLNDTMKSFLHPCICVPQHESKSETCEILGW